ncbi:hypothetical protein HDV03_001878 [Kappamyces sp. JEL0829]|nr:hypothetical protein HDV03_001878 [Kappamyces sp. JEL0829]
MKEQLNEYDLIAGLHSILEAMLFLAKSGFCHINVCEEVVYIDPKDAKWKLGNPEYILARSETSDASISQIGAMTDKLVLGEEKDPDRRMLRCFTEFLKTTIVSLTKSFQFTLIDWDKLVDLCDSAEQLEDVASSSFFTANPLISSQQQLQDYRLKDTAAKLETFESIPSLLKAIPVDSLEKHILPLILDGDFFAEPGTPGIFQFLAALPTSVVQTTVLPFLQSMLPSKTLETRLHLLEVLPAFFPFTEETYIYETLLPELIAGLDEADEELYFLSLHTLGTVAPLCIEVSSKLARNKTEVAQPHHPSRLIDLVISHCVRNALSGNPEYYWNYVEILTSLWRSIIAMVVLKGSNFPEMASIFRKLARIHHTIIQAMDSEQKIAYFSSRLISEKMLKSLEFHPDVETTWISKAIELVTPYLRDENQNVRKAASTSIVNWVALMDEIYNGRPSITKTRVMEGTVTKLKNSFPVLERKKSSFQRRIRAKQREALVDSEPPSKASPAKNTAIPYVKRQALNANRHTLYVQSSSQKSPVLSSPTFRSDGHSAGPATAGIHQIAELQVSAKDTTPEYALADWNAAPSFDMDDDEDVTLSHIKL